MARRYGTYTPARRVALRKAQLASARKRHARRKKIYAAAAIAGLGGAVIARHHLSKSKFIAGVKTPTINRSTTSVSGSPVRFDSAGFRVGKGTVIRHSGNPTAPAGFSHIKTGPGSHAFVYIHRSNGHDRNFTYAHNSLRHALFGAKTQTRVRRNNEPAPNGGVKLIGGKLAVDARAGVLAGSAGSAPSRQIGYGHYERQHSSNGGFSIRRRMAQIDARHGF